MCSDTIIVRRATENDIPAVISLYHELEGAYPLEEAGEAPDCRRLWQETMADARQQILVAEVNGWAVGTATLVIVPNLGHHGSAWAAVENVVVEPGYRKKGVGTELMKEAYRIARSHGCYKLVLTSNLARGEAHSFYRGLGWRQSHIGFSLDL